MVEPLVEELVVRELLDERPLESDESVPEALELEDSEAPEPRPLAVEDDRLPRLELEPDRLLEPLVESELDGLLETEITLEALVTAPAELVTRLPVLTLTLPETDVPPPEVPALPPHAARSEPAVSVIRAPATNRLPAESRKGVCRKAILSARINMLPFSNSSGVVRRIAPGVPLRLERHAHRGENGRNWRANL